MDVDNHPVLRKTLGGSENSMQRFKVGTGSMQNAYGGVHLQQAKGNLKRTVGMVGMNLIIAISS